MTQRAARTAGAAPGSGSSASRPDATPATPSPARRRCRHGRWSRLDFLLLIALAVLPAWLYWRTDPVFAYRWDWSTVWPYVFRFDTERHRWVANLLVEGLLTTLRLAVWGIVLAGIAGVVMGLCRTSERLFPRLLGTAYVMLIRNTPPLVFVFVFVYFIASQIMPGMNLGDLVAHWPPTARLWVQVLFGAPRLLDNFVLGLICLSVFSGAYVTEIVRAGIESVPHAQIEAGRSLGMSRPDVIRFIVLPQAFRNVLPPMAGQFIQLIKDSSLVSLVSIQELTFMAQDVQVSTQRVFEVFLLIAVVYFVICFGLSQVFAAFERRHAGTRR